MLKRLLLIVSAFVLLLPGLWLRTDWLVNRPINRVNYERIRVGTSLKETERIIGKPNKTTFGEELLGFFLSSKSRQLDVILIDSDGGIEVDSEGLPRAKKESCCWTSGPNSLVVHVDPAGVVFHKYYFCDENTFPPSIFFNLLPFWSLLLAEAIGLVIVIYLCLTWHKKAQRSLGQTEIAPIHDDAGIQVDKPIPPWERSGGFRLDGKPHRGRFLRGFATVGFILSIVAFFTPCWGWMPGLLSAFICLTIRDLAHLDLDRMQTGLIDPRGKALTQEALRMARFGIWLSTSGILIWGAITVLLIYRDLFRHRM